MSECKNFMAGSVLDGQCVNKEKQFYQKQTNKQHFAVLDSKNTLDCYIIQIV